MFMITQITDLVLLIVLKIVNKLFVQKTSFKFMKSLQASENIGRVQHLTTHFRKFTRKKHFNQKFLLLYYDTYPNK